MTVFKIKPHPDPHGSGFGECIRALKKTNGYHVQERRHYNRMVGKRSAIYESALDELVVFGWIY
jgi:hypothetical protein